MTIEALKAGFGCEGWHFYMVSKCAENASKCAENTSPVYLLYLETRKRFDRIENDFEVKKVMEWWI